MNSKTFNVYTQQPQQASTWYVPVSLPQQQQQQTQQAYAQPQTYGGTYVSPQQQFYLVQQHPSGAPLVYPIPQQYPVNYVPFYNPTPAAQQPTLIQSTYGAPVHQTAVPQAYASTPSKKLSLCDPVTKTELNFAETRIAQTRLRTISRDTNDEKKLASENLKHSVLLKMKQLVTTEKLEPATDGKDKRVEVVEPKPRRILSVESPPLPPPQKKTCYFYDRDTLLRYRKFVTDHKHLFPISMEVEQMDVKDANEPVVEKKEEKKKVNVYRPSGQHRVTPQQQQQRGVDSNLYSRPILRSETPALKRAAAAVDSRRPANATTDCGSGRNPETPSIATNDSPPVQLRKATNAWKPLRQAMKELDPKLAKLEKLKTEIRGIMNKITPTTFEKLTQQLCEMRVYKDAELLPHVVDIIFEKAVDEPKYCELYSKLCYELNCFEESETGQQALTGAFRCAVLHKCQKQFSERAENIKEKKEDDSALAPIEKSDVASDKKPVATDTTASDIEKTALAIGSTSTQSVEVQSALTKEEMELKKSKSKRHFLGTIRFISHIYRTRFIGPQILDHCLISLIVRYQKDNDEEYIEFLVQLYETIGRTYEEQRQAHFEQVRAAQAQLEKVSYPWRQKQQSNEKPPLPHDPYARVEQIYNHLRDHAFSYSIRTRVLVLNMVDMRKNNWKPRTVDKLTPKTMEELQMEVEEEKMREEQAREEYKNRQYRNGPPRQNYNAGSSGNNYTPPPGRPLAPTYAGGQCRMVNNDKIANEKRALAAHASMNACSSAPPKPRLGDVDSKSDGLARKKSYNFVPKVTSN